MKKERIKAELLKKLRGLPYFRKLQFISLYGSVPEGKAGKFSDIDVCLYYGIEDKEKLRRMLYRIKGMFPDKYDISMFQLLPLPVRKNVLKGVFLFSRSKAVYNIAFRTIQEYRDFEPRYRFYIMNTKSAPMRFML